MATKKMPEIDTSEFRDAYDRGVKAGLHQETVSVCIATVRALRVEPASAVTEGIVAQVVAALEGLRA